MIKTLKKNQIYYYKDTAHPNCEGYLKIADILRSNQVLLYFIDKDHCDFPHKDTSYYPMSNFKEEFILKKVSKKTSKWLELLYDR